ncbi:MAG: helix-turn-helix transcriptional regulator [Lachnospiraceae bacterium]|nr:helix-turn-helix transcriptional regulator [Lachnospiraceae bacterium]
MNLANIGKEIRKKRKTLNLKQAQLAEKADLSVDYISKLERGERIPKIPCFITILNVLGLSADEVLSDSLDKSYVSRTSEYLDRIGKLTKKEQERLFSMIELFLDEQESN